MLRSLASRVSRSTSRALASSPRPATAHRLAHPRGVFDMSASAAMTSPAATRVARVAVPRRAATTTTAPTRSSVRAYAASGRGFAPGEIRPFASLEVTAAESSATDAMGADALVVSLCEADAEALAADDATFEGIAPGLAALVHDLVTECEFKGKSGQTAFTRVGAGFPFKHVGLVGLGAAEEVTTATWIRLGREAAAYAKKAKCEHVVVRKYWLGEASAAEFESKAAAIALGARLGAFEDVRFKSEPEAAALQKVTIAAPEGAGDCAAALAGGAAAAAGVALTKQLVAAPPNVVTPTALADVAAMIAKEFPKTMKVKVLEKKECEKMGMGSFLGVAEASDEPPKFIHLTYTPPESKDGSGLKKVAVVGKGLTFDSGGYNIKAGAGSMIEMLKFDMGGAGATLGAARCVAEMAPPGVEAHFIVASCENMIGSRGLRPGDILRASNGKTIEVNNTDAEGRLTLADAIVYAEKTAGAETIVDVATLTGAIIVGLGPEVAGMFTPDDDLAKELATAAESAGEDFWRMPMQESYWQSCGMTSEYADMKNTGSRGGGAITAALFLKKFVEKKETRWAHLDIAGPVWDDKKGGATGFGTTTLAAWIAGQGKK